MPASLAPRRRSDNRDRATGPLTDLHLTNTGTEELAGGGGTATVVGTLKLRRVG
jgi:hypothetical protein